MLDNTFRYQRTDDDRDGDDEEEDDDKGDDVDDDDDDDVDNGDGVPRCLITLFVINELMMMMRM